MEGCVHQGRKLEEDCKLNFAKPLSSSNGNIYTWTDKAEIDDNINRWDNTLVGYVLGEKSYYFHLKACVTRLWKPTCSLEIYSRENEYLFFRFGTKKSVREY